ncbi:MAG: ABC transporter permease [Bacteroidetes bacterium GWF2_38_335]|nr:MAG: ABC transporter permease [Bacteroidetes bacterium GWF2_38_335]OFY81170.1 MAG: ABC transporter permease [Bacteroidetes bacterium RIFOXYA12_FULL_38_20]HBS85283.1 ABC transporter permease [Bacteroidales bacterium]
MNTEYFIAKRITWGKESKGNISKPIVNIAIVAIALGLCVMILAVSIVTGFKDEIRRKVVGFGSHIQIINHDTNYSYESFPIDRRSVNTENILKIEGVEHIQVFATKAGIMKAGDQNQGIVLKGVGTDFDWTFFENNLVDGKKIDVNGKEPSGEILLSRYLANLLKIELGDSIKVFFVDENGKLRGRPLVVSGLYDTGLEEFDKLFGLVDIRHIQKLNNWNENQVSGFEIMINDFDNLDELTGEVKNLAGYTYNEDGTKLKVESIKEKYPQEFDWLELQDINVWVILIIMIAVAGINMISSLLILILERTTMIGILKSLGAQNWSIRKIFLYNAGFLIGRGLLWGNIAGIAVSLIQFYFHVIPLDPSIYYINTVPINFNIFHILLLNAGSFIVIVFMLVVPSMIISKITPVKAISFK